MGTLAVSFTTGPAGGNYAPTNVVAVWIEDAGGGFVKTIGRWSGVRTPHLVAWQAASGMDTDAVSGATRVDHTRPLAITWDLRDRAGALVPDGTYRIRMELADANSTTEAQNNQGTFMFVKSAMGSMQSTSGGGFSGVAIDYVGDASQPGGADADPGSAPDDDAPVSGGCEAGGGAGLAVALILIAACGSRTVRKIRTVIR